MSRAPGWGTVILTYSPGTTGEVAPTQHEDRTLRTQAGSGALRPCSRKASSSHLYAASEPVRELESIRQTELPGHLTDYARRLGDRHSRRGDVQRPRRLTAKHLGGMRRGPEPGLGHSDDGSTELGMNMRAEAGPPAGVKVNITVNHDQREIGARRDHRPQRRQFTQVELARLIRRAPTNRRGPSPRDPRETPLARGHHRRASSAVVQVVDIDSHEQCSGIGRRLGHDLRISSPGPLLRASVAFPAALA